MMAAVAAAAASGSGGEQQEAAPEANARARPLPTLDPRLFMAARRGDRGQLRDLLRLDLDEEEEGAAGAGASVADGDVPVPVPVVADQVFVDIIQVIDPPAAAVAPPAPPAPDVAADGEEQGTRDGTPSTTAAGMSMADGMVDMPSLPPARQDDMVEVVDPQPPHDDVVPLPPPSVLLSPAAADIDAVDPQLHDDVAPPSAAAENDDTSVAPPPPASSRLPEEDEEDGLTIEGDSLLHVVAASGDHTEFLRCAKMIVRHKEKKGGAAEKRLALEARNNDGDTPLHCAAGAGNAAMIGCLLDLLGHDHEPAAFVRLQNERGETALHHAVKWACIVKRDKRAVVNADGCIGKLVAVDAELASIVTHDGTSPLYLAIFLGEMEIARYLLVTAKEAAAAGNGNDLLSYYSGPGGQNILHAAVSYGDAQALRMVLEWVKKGPKRSRPSASAATSSSADDDDDVVLIRQLTSQRDKKNGSTPLHLAVSLYGFPSTGIIPARTWKRSGRPAAWLLLDANESTAYQPDKEGMYPIHAAAGAVTQYVLRDLLRRCPECATLRDAKGRTFLHVAVDNGAGLPVVRYVCRTPKLSWILNLQDKNGDTALHRAVHGGYYRTFRYLFRNRQVRLHVQNNEGMRPIDVAWSTMSLEAYYAWDPRIQIRNSLLKVSAPYDGASRGDLFRGKLLHAETTTTTVTNTSTNKDVHGASEGLTSAAQVMGILSVLVTTVTFATAFTLPGGYRSAGDGGGVPGTPVLAGSYAFDAFLLADALAFICSLLATSLLLYAGVPAGSLTGRFHCVNRAYALMMNSGRSLVAAFGLGLYVAMSPVARVIPIAIAVLAAMLAYVFIKGGEGIDSLLFTFPVFPRRRPPSVMEVVAACIVFVLERFWSFILIFGLPAIRKWAGAR